MIGGVDHVGIIVSDIGRSLSFYRDTLGFREVMWDHIGVIPGMDRVMGKENVRMRTVMLRSEKIGPLGQGGVKLIQLLSPHKANPLDRKYIWGDTGIAEFALNVHNIEEVSKQLAKKGVEIVRPPQYLVLDDKEVKYAYIRDADSILIELIELAMDRGFGGSPRIEGVNHVGIGVSDIGRSLSFYRDTLGFREVMWDHTGIFEGIPPLETAKSSLKPIKMRIVMLTNKYRSAWIEIIRHLPPHKPRPEPASWGHIGHVEFAIEVSTIENVYKKLQKENVQFMFPPQTVDFPPFGEWKYADVFEPDNLCVSLVETQNSLDGNPVDSDKLFWDK